MKPALCKVQQGATDECDTGAICISVAVAATRFALLALTYLVVREQQTPAQHKPVPRWRQPFNQ
jgi:hypothetical protein